MRESFGIIADVIRKPLLVAVRDFIRDANAQFGLRSLHAIVKGLLCARSARRCGFRRSWPLGSAEFLLTATVGCSDSGLCDRRSRRDSRSSTADLRQECATARASFTPRFPRGLHAQVLMHMGRAIRFRHAVLRRVQHGMWAWLLWTSLRWTSEVRHCTWGQIWCYCQAPTPAIEMRLSCPDSMG